MKNMTLKAIAKAIDGKAYNIEKADGITANGVVIDSRQVEEGYIFIAIKGERVDGHSFINQVYDKGALAVVCEEAPQNCDKPYIVVESSTKALKEMAKYYRDNLDIKLVGITGSVGKTSTKEFIASVLSQKYNVLKTEGNFNNEIGLPLTILRIRDEHQIAVIEMGISHFGDMKPLGEIAQPDICVITNIGYCHLEYLIDRDGVLKEKTDMFNYAKANAEYILNADDDKLATVSNVKGKTPVFVSVMDDKRSIHVKNMKMSGIEGSVCDISVYGDDFEITVPLPGKHMVSNALVACAVGKICDVSIEQIKQGIAELKPVGGRVNIIKNDKYTIIDDCYNANPVSMKASIDVLQYANTRKVAVLGDMFELGSEEAILHGEVGTYLSKIGANIDELITVGKLSKNIEDAAIKADFKGVLVHYNTLDECLDNIEKKLEIGDTILLKASHGMHLEKIINLLTK